MISLRLCFSGRYGFSDIEQLRELTEPANQRGKQHTGHRLPTSVEGVRQKREKQEEKDRLGRRTKSPAGEEEEQKIKERIKVKF